LNKHYHDIKIKYMRIRLNKRPINLSMYPKKLFTYFMKLEDFNSGQPEDLQGTLLYEI